MSKARVKVYSRFNRDTGERESLDDLMRRFKKLVNNELVLYDYKRHECFVKKSLRRKIKAEESAKRARRKGNK